MVEDLVNYYIKLKRKENLYIGGILEEKNVYIKLEEFEVRFSSFIKLRLSVIYFDKDKY